MESDTPCSFCGRQLAEAVPALTGRAGERICTPCVDLARDVLEMDARGEIERPKHEEVRDEPLPGWRLCAFCGLASTEVRKLVAGPSVAICDGCLHRVAAA